MSTYSRRLPMYLVLDCSESMAGVAIAEVQRGVEALVTQLKGDPMALETVYISVITFDREARQALPLTELMRFQTPKLTVRTGTALGAALRLLKERVEQEVIRTTSTTKGDYKPLVFLLTDGQPTDEWQAAAAAVRGSQEPRFANVYAIGCGPDVDTEALYQVSDIVLQMQDLSPESFRKFFIWLSASVQTASIAITRAAGTPIDLPALPQGVLELAPRGVTRPQKPRQVFMHALCQRTGRPYLMRYAYRGDLNGYAAVAGHPLEAVEPGDASLLLPISSNELYGAPVCPHCENDTFSRCPCGALSCERQGSEEPWVCRACNTTLKGWSDEPFTVTQSMG